MSLLVCPLQKMHYTKANNWTLDMWSSYIGTLKTLLTFQYVQYVDIHWTCPEWLAWFERSKKASSKKWLGQKSIEWNLQKMPFTDLSALDLGIKAMELKLLRVIRRQ